VRRLSQHAPTLQQETELPRRPPSDGLALVHHDGVQQPAPSYCLDERRVDSANGAAEALAEECRARGEVLVDEYLKGCYGDGAAERISERLVISICGLSVWVWGIYEPAIGAAVFSRLDTQHHVLIGQNSRHQVNCNSTLRSSNSSCYVNERQTSSRQSLPKQQHIWTNPIVLGGKHLSRPAQTLIARQ
jgi:hypothetical protein